MNSRSCVRSNATQAVHLPRSACPRSPLTSRCRSPILSLSLGPDTRGLRSTPSIARSAISSATLSMGAPTSSRFSVAPAHARRGVGAALINRLGADAAAQNRPALTLTTFRDVPWNAPYYTRLGFVVLGPAEQGPELRALIERETSSIPSNAARVAMGRPTPRGCPRARFDGGLAPGT